jgi:hypothetical protein
MLGSDPLPDANIPQKLDAILKEKRKGKVTGAMCEMTIFWDLTALKHALFRPI